MTIEHDNNQPFSLTFDNTLLSEDYQKGNIKIIDTHAKSDKCLIFCSGNGLYFPNTKEEYTEKIRKNDRYEWEHIAHSKNIEKNFSKLIFIRDIYKQWYVSGINKELHCIDALVEYIKTETKKYKIITVGSSAGGYTAVLLGILLNAYRIVTVSGQYYLWSFVDRNPLLRKYKDDIHKSKYYDLRNILKNSDSQIVYIFPVRCENDLEQYNYVKNYSNIQFYRINSQNHGTGINSAQYPYIFLSDMNKMEKIYERYKDRIINGNMFYCDINTWR
ncbi:MAG: hypothetical protein LBG73_11385 [Spirochaetaceae bacterium]|jgi:hypothetical protein|nr:hypothetical protein [Spirochaetaceae bacterium]